MKIQFDASIHLGQFSNDEAIRIACKNSQLSISNKPESGTVGITTFNENSWVDHIIWDLEREQQDIFYPFMDVFHSIKNIERIALNNTDVDLAKELIEKLGLEISDALTCASAISNKADAIHTYYPSLLKNAVVEHIRANYGIEILIPTPGAEGTYSDPLEEHYGKALNKFKSDGIELFNVLLEIKKKQ